MIITGKGPYLGGGSKPILVVTVLALEAAAVTATKGAKTVSLTDTGDGVWMGNLPGKGAWTVSATDGAYTSSKTVEVTGSVASVEIVLFPVGYTPLEYIQSTGTQYIDTGITFDGTKGVSLHVKMSLNGDTAPYNAILFGFYDGNQPLKRGYFGFTSSGTSDSANMAVGYGDIYSFSVSKAVLASSSPIEFWETITNGEQSIRFSTGQSSKLTYARGFLKTDLTSYLFAIHSDDGISYNHFRCKLNLAEVTVGDEAVGWFYPAVRVSDLSVGMVNLVNAEWHPNMATDPFISGPEITA